MSTVAQSVPSTPAEAAAALAAATAEGHAVRIRGGGTKIDWGAPLQRADVELSTLGLDQIVEHNVGDLTAILQAGAPLSRAQSAFAAAGQMLALDPPLRACGDDPEAATIGGIVATGDTGPLRHRYGGPRDLVVGATVALSDGSIARSGGKVIKNVAGYDLAKLLAGSFGTLGMIVEVSVRLHPLHERTTARAVAEDPDLLAAAAVRLAATPLEFEALDLAWGAGRGALLARCAGAEHARRARRAAKVMAQLGLTDPECSDDDAALWERQRAGQRSPDRAVVRASYRPSALAAVLRASDRHGGLLVGRAGLGSSYVALGPESVTGLRAAVGAVATTIVLDAPPALRRDDAWGAVEPAAVELMRSVKGRFDPTRTCNPGLFVDGI